MVLNMQLSAPYIFYVYDGRINLSNEMELVISEENTITHAH